MITILHMMQCMLHLPQLTLLQRRSVTMGSMFTGIIDICLKRSHVSLTASFSRMLYMFGILALIMLCSKSGSLCHAPDRTAYGSQTGCFSSLAGPFSCKVPGRSADCSANLTGDPGTDITCTYGIECSSDSAVLNLIAYVSGQDRLISGIVCQDTGKDTVNLIHAGHTAIGDDRLHDTIQERILRYAE